MTFGEKLRMLRTAQGLTQDELARKIYVTRTAVSKWEADRGFPNIDSLKLLASVFGVGLDELLSYGEAEAARQAEARRASVLYAAAMVFLALTVLFALLAYCLRQRYFLIGSVAGTVGYLICGLAMPFYRRAATAHPVRTAAARLVIAGVLVAVTVAMDIGHSEIVDHFDPDWIRLLHSL